jgi:hypothetical protein
VITIKELHFTLQQLKDNMKWYDFLYNVVQIHLLWIDGDTLPLLMQKKKIIET